MTRDGLTEENLRDGSVKDISHRSRGRPENKEEFVPERERKKAENVQQENNNATVADEVDPELLAKVLANPEMRALLNSLAKTMK